jgi:hypothetical protein
LIDIAAFTDERGLRIAAKGTKMIVPSGNQFNAERILKSQGRTGTADNDHQCYQLNGNDSSRI